MKCMKWLVLFSDSKKVFLLKILLLFQTASCKSKCCDMEATMVMSNQKITLVMSM